MVDESPQRRVPPCPGLLLPDDPSLGPAEAISFDADGVIPEHWGLISQAMRAATLAYGDVMGRLDAATFGPPADRAWEALKRRIAADGTGADTITPRLTPIGLAAVVVCVANLGYGAWAMRHWSAAMAAAPNRALR